MWHTRREQATAKRAAAEFRKIADLVERIGVDPDGKAHPEIATIADNLAKIRVELGKTVRGRGMSETSRRIVASGFNNIGKAL